MPHILHGVAIGLFISAGATSIGTIAASICPQWARIVSLALGNVEPAFTPFDQSTDR
ncbi:hypothetical protein [Sphingomonas sp. UV9]|uniref:hypothetical protein n=1 Tax=Sphingomonas sp. UV9 TaxID=1851410 RepID=UPI0013E8CBEA|nr:hypothetical protein [Sphingomonas sp. UV9]